VTCQAYASAPMRPRANGSHTRTIIVLRRVIVVNLVFPSILEFAHLLGGLFACLATGSAAGLLWSWSRIGGCAFWHSFEHECEVAAVWKPKDPSGATRRIGSNLIYDK
jgi:hypothetical protein